MLFHHKVEGLVFRTPDTEKNKQGVVHNGVQPPNKREKPNETKMKMLDKYGINSSDLHAEQRHTSKYLTNLGALT